MQGLGLKEIWKTKVKTARAKKLIKKNPSGSSLEAVQPHPQKGAIKFVCFFSC